MSSRDRPDLIARFCSLLGRQHVLSGPLDWVAGWFLPPPPALAPAGGFLSPDEPDGPAESPDLTFMSTMPFPEGAAPPAPTTPHTGHDTDVSEPGVLSWLWHTITGGNHTAKKSEAKHAKAACSEKQYQGMHGRPCKYASGTDLKCPKGTVSGWYWRFDTPVGIIYYVDCCGGSPTVTHNVWCNWSNEPNWCLGAGRSANLGITDYTCTLAIPDKLMKVVELGPGKYEVSGVDP